MKYIINNINFEIIITRKRIKNTYLRVNGKSIYITTNYYIKDNDILKLIKEKETSILKMFEHGLKKDKYQNDFYFLGKKYDIIYMNTPDIIVGDKKIFINHDFDIDKWLLKQAKEIFQEELDKIYKIFPKSIPYPKLTIRNMKTRWGVCNVGTNRVTLNFNLILRDIKYIDYVIIHELSHLIHHNHSKDFWTLVSILEPNYKKLRKELNSYE